MRSPLQFVFIAALLTAAACNAGGGGPSAPIATPAASPAPSPDVTEIQIFTEAQPAQACMDALAMGRLVPDTRSGLGFAGPDGVSNPVMWPFGYTARLVDNEIELHDSEGAFVAREGDQIEMGGGSGANGLFFACGGSVQIAN